MTKSRGINAPRKPWSAADLELLRLNYADSKTSDIATALGRKPVCVYRMAAKLQLKKSAEYMDSDASCRLRRGDEVGKGYRFPKGHVPANKGLRRPGWSAGNMSATQFKPGQKPRNYLPLGAHRISGDGYLQRKVSLTGYPPRDWESVHRLVWVEAHGPVPKGSVVCFKAGRYTTELAAITLDALECITHAERMARNTIHNLPKELADVVRLRGVLNRSINKRSKTP